MGREKVYPLVALYILFIAGIAIALLLSLEWILWPCIFFAGLINSLFIFYAFRPGKPSYEELRRF